MDKRTYNLAKLSVSMDLIKRGVRSAACLTIPLVFLDEVFSEIEKAGLKSYPIQCGECHADVTIFRHEHLRQVIPQIDELQDPLRAWAYGKLFGYSEEAIGEFIAGRSTSL
jgi:hypothetical protein